MQLQTAGEGITTVPKLPLGIPDCGLHLAFLLPGNPTAILYLALRLPSWLISCLLTSPEASTCFPFLPPAADLVFSPASTPATLAAAHAAACTWSLVLALQGAAGGHPSTGHWVMTQGHHPNAPPTSHSLFTSLLVGQPHQHVDLLLHVPIHSRFLPSSPFADIYFLFSFPQSLSN